MRNAMFLFALSIIFLSNCSRTEVAEVVETNDSAEIPQTDISQTSIPEPSNEISANSIVVPWAVGLRLRESPETTANVLGSLGLWEKLTVIEIKDEVETINGNSGNWVRVRRENSQTTGWAFSHFLERIDEDKFLPIWEYSNGDVMRADIYTEIYTMYYLGIISYSYSRNSHINERRRQRLTLFWDGRHIDTFDKAILSDNGRVMAFNWVDPATIRLNADDDTMTGIRYLFVYNFSNHTLIKIDEHSMMQSDSQSERWVNELWHWEGGFPPDFINDTNLVHFILNSNGSRIFYNKGQHTVEVDLAANTSTMHQIDTQNYFLLWYMGNLVLLSGMRNGWSTPEIALYDPLQERLLSEFNFHRPIDPNAFDFSSHVPLSIIQDRYLLTHQDEDEYTGLILHDLQTNRQRRLHATENNENHIGPRWYEIELVNVRDESRGEWSYVPLQISVPSPLHSGMLSGRWVAISIVDLDDVVFSSDLRNPPVWRHIRSPNWFQRIARMNNF